MSAEHLTRQQELLDIAAIDRFAAQSGEYPICYAGEGFWFFIWRGENRSGKQPRHARHQLAEAIRAES